MDSNLHGKVALITGASSRIIEVQMRTMAEGLA
jgi:NAD(P)-dependent dehydrogenase (short-subunit alcohol dehydrogenase family)